MPWNADFHVNFSFLQFTQVKFPRYQVSLLDEVRKIIHYWNEEAAWNHVFRRAALKTGL